MPTATDPLDSTADPVTIRQLVPGDLPYVYSTWLRDLRDADGGPLPDDLFFMAHRGFIDQLMADPGVTALVACASDAPDEILGYVVAEAGETLLWIQIKRPLRKQGLAGRLLRAAHISPGVKSAWTTPLARERLNCRQRGRQVRRDMRARRLHDSGSTGSNGSDASPAVTRP